MERAAPTPRKLYPHITRMPTRWGDNDSYGHVNNVVYYSFFDSAVNRHLIQQGVLDIAASPLVGPSGGDALYLLLVDRLSG